MDRPIDIATALVAKAIADYMRDTLRETGKTLKIKEAIADVCNGEMETRVFEYIVNQAANIL